jgi:predicted aldo/keto reductase-like oxidoreductase
MVYNDLFCLSDPKIHTLSLGVSRPSDFDEHLKALPYLESGEAKALSDDIYHNFKTHLHAACGSDLMAVIAQLPTYEAVPHHVNLKVILRLWSLYKAFGMETYGKMRYNLLGNGGHWFPGIKMEPEHQDDIRAFCSNFPEGARLYDAVHEACTQLVGEEQKRLSETD